MRYILGASGSCQLALDEELLLVVQLASDRPKTIP